jgi:hypothetical protein
MGPIEISDDSKSRWVVFHYRYVEQRKQRRQVVIACFDNRREWRRFIREDSKRLQAAKEGGTADPKERISGNFRPAGYDRAYREVRRLSRNSARSTPMEISGPGTTEDSIEAETSQAFPIETDVPGMPTIFAVMPLAHYPKARLGRQHLRRRFSNRKYSERSRLDVFRSKIETVKWKWRRNV